VGAWLDHPAISGQVQIPLHGGEEPHVRHVALTPCDHNCFALVGEELPAGLVLVARSQENGSYFCDGGVGQKLRWLLVTHGIVR
jgi:hypothetical protein